MTAARAPKRLLLSAFGINAGGGLVLFEALLRAARSRLLAISVDTRLRSRDLGIDRGVPVRYVARGFLRRAWSLQRLAAVGTSTDVLFCFNSLPPLTRPRCRVINYVHAPHFVGLHRGIRYAPVTRVRIAVERVLFRLGIRHCDEIWVQTPTMAAALQAAHPRAVVRVVPFVDDALHAMLSAAPPGSHRDAPACTFFYPADDVGHKNHGRLIEAWKLLAAEGIKPRLELTLTTAELARCCPDPGDGQSSPAHIAALGRLPREQVLERMRHSSALIFPSLAETLGIPLLEAEALGVPVLAAERDFVRDVCAPRETFDPTSARSIADAVRRFLGASRQRERMFTAREILDRLLA